MTPFETAARAWLAARAFRPGQPAPFSLKDLLGHLAAHIQGSDNAALTQIFTLADEREMAEFHRLFPQAFAMMTARMEKATNG